MHKLPLLVAAAMTAAGVASLMTSKMAASSPDTPLVPFLFSLTGLTLSLIMIAAFNTDFSVLAAVGADLGPGAPWPPNPCLIGP
jgi:hypothetical protein